MPSGKPGKIKLLLNCANGKGFGVALVLIFMALINYLFLPIFGNETKCCFEPFFPGEFGMASCSVRKRKKIPCRFCGAPDDDGHVLGDCTFSPFVELRNNPEFLPLMSKDRTHWPRCLLGHDWLPGLTSRTSVSPWAIASSDLASHSLENALGPHPLSTHSAWHPFLDQDDVQDMVDDVPFAPNIWTDGSREPIPHLDVEIAGAGASVHSPVIIFDSRHSGHAQDLDDPHEGSSHIFSGVLGPIQSVQRAEYWGVILALQAYSGIHIGIDN